MRWDVFAATVETAVGAGKSGERSEVQRAEGTFGSRQVRRIYLVHVPMIYRPLTINRPRQERCGTWGIRAVGLTGAYPNAFACQRKHLFHIITRDSSSSILRGILLFSAQAAVLALKRVLRDALLGISK